MSLHEANLPDAAKASCRRFGLVPGEALLPVVPVIEVMARGKRSAEPWLARTVRPSAYVVLVNINPSVMRFRPGRAGRQEELPVVDYGDGHDADQGGDDRRPYRGGLLWPDSSAISRTHSAIFS
jgi:hypothetical protein